MLDGVQRLPGHHPVVLAEQGAALGMVELDVSAAKLGESSDGRITVEIFPAGQLGSWEEMQEALELGSLDVLVESLGSLERYTPLAGIEGLPFLYEDDEHFIEVWSGPLADEILGAIREESGFQLLGQLYRGGRLLNTTRPVKELTDLAGLKLRVPTQQTYIDTWQMLGASPTPMSFNEVFSALEQGALDGQENPIDVIRFNSMYEVAPFITETNHIYGNFHFQLWGDAFEAWSAEDQRLFKAAVDEVSASYLSSARSSVAEHRTYLEGEGVTFLPIDLGAWRQKVAAVIDGADPRVVAWSKKIADRDY
mgnify:CR=1 FL=1